MPRKRVYWTLATTVLVAFLVLLFILSGSRLLVSRPLVSGKPVSYWLNNVPAGASLPGLLPEDNPLVTAGPEIIPALTAAVKSRYPDRALINHLRATFPSLRPHLPDYPPDWMFRGDAAFRLGLFGPAASNAVPALLALFKNPPAEFTDKWRVIQALGFIGPPAKDAVPILIDNLRDQNGVVRMASVDSLLKIGVVPPEAIPALKKNLGDQDHVAAKMAVAIFAAERSPEALSRVKSVLTDKRHQSARAIAAQSLASVPELPGELVDVLAEMLDDKNASVRQGAALALAKPHARNLDRIIAVLIEGVGSGQFQIPCAQALGKLGPEAAAAKPALEHKTGYVLGIAARDALKNISAAQTSVPSP